MDRQFRIFLAKIFLVYFGTLGLVTDVELELDDEELLVETLRTFMVATSSVKNPMNSVLSFITHDITNKCRGTNSTVWSYSEWN